MYLRNGKRVGPAPMCQCGKYYANSHLSELCSSCYYTVFAPPLNSAWVITRDREAAGYFMTEDIFLHLQERWASAPREHLCAILRDQRENGRYLSYAQLLRLWAIPNSVDEYARVHIFCPFVFDRWNIGGDGALPSYAACYYGEAATTTHTREQHFRRLAQRGLL